MFLSYQISRAMPGTTASIKKPVFYGYVIAEIVKSWLLKWFHGVVLKVDRWTTGQISTPQNSYLQILTDHKVR